MFPLISNLIAAVIITLYVLLGLRLEEKKLYLEYGEAYKQYAKKVPGLIPNIFAEKYGFLLTRVESNLICGRKWSKVVGSRVKLR